MRTSNPDGEERGPAARLEPVGGGWLPIRENRFPLGASAALGADHALARVCFAERGAERGGIAGSTGIIRAIKFEFPGRWEPLQGAERHC